MVDINNNSNLNRLNELLKKTSSKNSVSKQEMKDVLSSSRANNSENVETNIYSNAFINVFNDKKSENIEEIEQEYLKFWEEIAALDGDGETVSDDDLDALFKKSDEQKVNNSTPTPTPSTTPTPTPSATPSSTPSTTPTPTPSTTPTPTPSMTPTPTPKAPPDNTPTTQAPTTQTPATQTPKNDEQPRKEYDTPLENFAQEGFDISESLYGTEFTKAIQGASSKQDVFNIILDNCSGNEQIAEKIYEYIMSPVASADDIKDLNTSNPYNGRKQRMLMEHLYINNGSKFVLHPNLLAQFTEYEATGEFDENGEEITMPTKQYYTNFDGKLCTIEHNYDGVSEDGIPYITLSFKEGSDTRNLSYYIVENGEDLIYCVLDENGDIEETEQEFLKRLNVMQNYTNDTNEKTLTTEEVQQRYTMLKEREEQMASTLVTIEDEFASEGVIDDFRNWLHTVFDTSGNITNQELIDEVNASTRYSEVLLLLQNGNYDEAKQLLGEELNRRLEDNPLSREELSNYFQNDDIVNTLLSPQPTRDFKTHKDYLGNRDFTVEEAYYFLTNGGQYSPENVEAYNQASELFTDYNTVFAYENALEECETPEDAFKIITGKDIKDASDEDIALFNSYFSQNRFPSKEAIIDSGNEEYFEYVMYKPLSEATDEDIAEFNKLYKGMNYFLQEMPDGSQRDMYYRLFIEVDDKKQFHVTFERYDSAYDTTPTISEELPSVAKGIFRLDEYDTEQFRNLKFDEFYEQNKEEVDDYIDNYAAFAAQNDECRKHFKGKCELTPEGISAYIKENPYDESCNYMQYAYTTSKQTLYGESRLDAITSKYCTDMAAYSSTLSHMLSIGCIAASVIFPAASPVLIPMARAAGYLDNGMDLLNMVTNRQGYQDDNYGSWALQTGFEVIMKAGYRYLSGVASKAGQKVTELVIDRTGGASSFFVQHAIPQILLRGGSEAVIETAICVPYTMAIKAMQGGEYSLSSEFIENFIYDFLPYARGYRDILTSGSANVMLYGGDGVYYQNQGDSERLYFDTTNPDKPRPSKLVSVVDGQETDKIVYNYNDDDGSCNVLKYNDDGSIKSNTTVFSNSDGTGKIVDGEDPSKVLQTTEKDGSGYKITAFDESGKISQTVYTDKNGRITSVSSGLNTVEYSKSGKIKRINCVTEDGTITIDCKRILGKTQITVTDEFGSTVDVTGDLDVAQVAKYVEAGIDYTHATKLTEYFNEWETTPEEQEKIVNSVKQGASIEVACEIANANLDDKQIGTCLTLINNGVNTSSAIEISKLNLSESSLEQASMLALCEFSPAEIKKVTDENLKEETFSKFVAYAKFNNLPIDDALKLAISVKNETPVNGRISLFSQDGEMYIEDAFGNKHTATILGNDIYEYTDEDGMIYRYSSATNKLQKGQIVQNSMFEDVYQPDNEYFLDDDGNVTKTGKYIYDEKGKVTEEIIFDSYNNISEIRKNFKYKSGVLQSYSTYNAQNEKVSTVELYKTGKLAKLYTYENNVTKISEYQKDGETLIKQTISTNNDKDKEVIYYDDAGEQIVEKNIYSEGQIVNETYEAGKLRDKTTYSKTNGKQIKTSTENYYYSADGKPVLVEEYDAFNNLKSQTRYTYKNGLCVNKESVDSDGNKLSSISYEYNADGVTTKRTTVSYEDGEVKYKYVDDLAEDGSVTKRVKYNPDGTVKAGIQPAEIQKIIETQFNNKTTDDVNRIVSDVAEATDLTEEETLYTLQKLSQFSNMKSMKVFGEELSALGISGFYKINAVCANSALTYVARNKQQLDLTGTDGEMAFILDDAGLSYLEQIQGTKEFNNIVNNDKIIFIIPEGWNCGFNLYSQGMDDAEISLKTQKIINQAQQLQEEKSISYEDALKVVMDNGTVERAAALGIKPYLLSLTGSLDVADSSADKVADNLSHYSLTDEKIGKIAGEIAKEVFPGDSEMQKEAQELLNGYFATQLDLYSPERLGTIMKDMHSSITEQVKQLKKADGSSYTEDDIIYIIPDATKSYSQIALQYATINGISPDKFKYTNLRDSNLEDGKIFVVLDDVVGSGTSMVSQGDGPGYESFNYRQLNNSHVIMAPVVSGQTGYERIQRAIHDMGREGQDFLLVPDEGIQTPYYDTEYYKNLLPYQQKMLTQILSSCGGSFGSLGFKDDAGYAILFPYMAPDNDAAINYFLFKHLMNNPNAIKNKPQYYEIK